MEAISAESSAAQSYVAVLQNVIGRMAANSSACKTWCVTLVAAIFVLTADAKRSEYIGVSLIPVVLFCGLDAYYLGLERCFRKLYGAFIRKLHDGTASTDDLFIVNPGSTAEIAKAGLRAVLSISVWPFYGLLAALMLAVRAWLIGSGCSHT